MSLTLPTMLGGLALLGVIAYGVLGGADFGGGVWDLTASGPRAKEQREAIARALAPVWEANHVWLIFVLVVLFGGFPPAFEALSVGLYGAFHVALVGITLRGAAFVFRAYGPQEEGPVRRWGAVFGAASALTPVLLGMCLGAVSSGRLRVRADLVHTPEGSALLSPVSLAMGAFALAVCAYTAAVFLFHATQGALREDFRRRALAVGTVVVALSVALVPLLRLYASHLWEGLFSARALPVVAVGVMAALGSGLALLRRRSGLARVCAVAQVACLLAGWGLAQFPYVIYPDLTLHGTAAPPLTQRFYLYSLPLGAALLGPSLWLLFRVAQRPAPAGEH